MKDTRNKIILGALFGLAVVAGLLLAADVRGAGAYLRDFPVVLALPVLALTLFNYVLRWAKWHYYLHLIGVTDLPVRDSAALWVSGFVLALSPGKVAELLKAAVLRGMAGTPVARSAPIVVAERVTDGLAMLVLGAGAFGGMLINDAAQQGVLRQYVPGYLVVLGLLVGGIVVLQIRPLFAWVLSITARLPLIGRATRQLEAFYESSYELFRPVPLLAAVGLGVVSWAGECAGFTIILSGLGLEPSLLLFWQATFILATATIVGAVSGLPGGLGAAEFSMAGLIQLLIVGQGGAALAATATLLIRLFTLWFAVLLGFLAAVAFRRRLFPGGMDDLEAAARVEAGPASVYEPR